MNCTVTHISNFLAKGHCPTLARGGLSSSDVMADGGRMVLCRAAVLSPLPAQMTRVQMREYLICLWAPLSTTMVRHKLFYAYYFSLFCVDRFSAKQRKYI